MDNRTKMEKEIEQLIAEISILEQTAENIRQRLTIAEATYNEHRQTYDTLNSLRSEKPNTEALIAIGSGSYIKCVIVDVESVLLNMGSNVYVEKKVDDAMKIIEERANSILKLRDSLQQQLVNVATRLEEARRRLAELGRSMEGGRTA
ncbi:MAG: prefoldin subunit alpha [Nitrososphaerota archaeon]|nr:prefoldin subunit alpha [Candidatus Bathyarchaeota archaeon]MCX8162766.1 prefoldin subunit alpha [Candidatus Bathyarchaeota archaeon]MDW8061361.1 prefoldin subunit alpha [Nitrososphaerota archaeon]